MSDSPQRVSEIIGSVQLVDVRVRRVMAEGSPTKAEAREMSVALEHSGRILTKTAEGFDVAADIAVRAFPEEPTGKGRRSRRVPPLLSIEVTVELHYRIPRIRDFSAQDLSKFANINGVYNAWPYWRELIQNLSLRMGLPPLVLPVFRIPQRQAEDLPRQVKRARRAKANG